MKRMTIAVLLCTFGLLLCVGCNGNDNSATKKSIINVEDLYGENIEEREQTGEKEDGASQYGKGSEEKNMNGKNPNDDNPDKVELTDKVSHKKDINESIESERLFDEIESIHTMEADNKGAEVSEQTGFAQTSESVSQEIDTESEKSTASTESNIEESSTNEIKDEKTVIILPADVFD